MRQFVVKRTAANNLHSVEAFDESDHLGAAVAADLAQIEGLEPTIFLGADLNDVVRSNEGFFTEAAA